MRARNLVLLVVVATLAGCMTYRYRDEPYKSRAEALAAQKADIDSVLNGTERRPNPVASYARVIIPNKDAIFQRGLREGGSEDARDYVATVLYNSYRTTPDTIKKRNLFARLDVEETSTPDHLKPSPGVIIIYAYLSTDKKAGGWYYISESTPRTPLQFETGASDLAKRWGYLLDSIEALAVSEKRN